MVDQLDVSYNKKVLITGGTGYLGARIGEFLLAHGYEVDLGSRNPSTRGLVQGCNQILTNWDDPELSFCKGYDLIVHAAGLNAQDCRKYPQLAIEFNGKTTERFVEKAAFYGCKRFFYLSTVHVYKSPLVGRFNEKSENLNSHPYATSHLLGEQALIRHVKKSPMQGHVLRLSNCFGYPLTQDSNCWELVLNEFIRDAYKLGKITIKGDYFSKRDFLPISELNHILIKIFGITEVIPDVINISSGSSRTLLEVANQVRDVTTEMTGKPINILKKNISENSHDLIIENNALLEMGILPNDMLTEEIKLMLNYLKSNF